jgi:hypothetical protein
VLISISGPPAVTISSAREEAENHWSDVVEEVE